MQQLTNNPAILAFSNAAESLPTNPERPSPGFAQHPYRLQPRRAQRRPALAQGVFGMIRIDAIWLALGSKRMGEEISEPLDCVPAQFFVHRHIRSKYACACCQTVLAASMPAQISAKYDDHLPLFRQEEIYRRSGAFIARSSMAGWVGQCGVQLELLVKALGQHLLSQGVQHGDETPVKLLQPGLGKTHQAYMWAWRTKDVLPKLPT